MAEVQDIIYRLYNFQVEEKIKFFVDTEVKTQFVHLTNMLQRPKREEIGNEFINGDSQFLLATPNMYALNADFKKFLHDQIKNKEKRILILV